MTKKTEINRRNFLGQSLSAVGALSLGSTYADIASSSPWLSHEALKKIGPLQSPDQNGIRLPKGFKSRILAYSGQGVPKLDGTKSTYKWHPSPDGGACFPLEDGGWVYTSNSEVEKTGGAGALRFNSKGQIVDAYSILKDTNYNCAGGPTPWGTWLSCEEFDQGRVYECDILGQGAQVREGLGSFAHEAVAIDPVRNQAYLTEDKPDGCLYRFTPNDPSADIINFDSGILEVAVRQGDKQLGWKLISNPNPSKKQTPTRKQVANARIFRGGEGIWFHKDIIYFTTKHDNKLWKYHVVGQKIEVLYDKSTSPTPILSGVDNVVVTPTGHVLVGEDDGDMQIVAVGPQGDVFPILQIVGQNHSEITGPAISPNFDRLYFSSQRGGPKRQGITYEITGNFS